MDELPRCVMCERPTQLHHSVWFASGPISVCGTIVQTGCHVPACIDHMGWRMRGQDEFVLLLP